MDNHGDVFGGFGDVFLPGLFVNLAHKAIHGLFDFFLHLEQSFGSVLLHEIVFVIEIDIVFRHFFELFFVHYEFGVIKLVAVNGFLKNVFTCRIFFDRFPVSELNLDIFPLSGHASCHILFSISNLFISALYVNKRLLNLKCRK